MPNPTFELRIERLLSDHQFRCGSKLNDGEIIPNSCWGAGCTWEGPFSEHRGHQAQVLIEALHLRQEYAVSSGNRRNFEPFETREAAERGWAYAMSNNQRWEDSGKELPVWAHDPHVESRIVSTWERDHA